MTTLVNALLGLTDAVQAITVELRLQRVQIAKLGALRQLDKEEVAETLDGLGQKVVSHEGKINRLALVRPPTMPSGPPGPPPVTPASPPIPKAFPLVSGVTGQTKPGPFGPPVYTAEETPTRPGTPATRPRIPNYPRRP